MLYLFMKSVYGVLEVFWKKDLIVKLRSIGFPIDHAELSRDLRRRLCDRTLTECAASKSFQADLLRFFSQPCLLSSGYRA
jgi:hypothetical protein